MHLQHVVTLDDDLLDFARRKRAQSGKMAEKKRALLRPVEVMAYAGLGLDRRGQLRGVGVS